MMQDKYIISDTGILYQVLENHDLIKPKSIKSKAMNLSYTQEEYEFFEYVYEFNTVESKRFVVRKFNEHLNKQGERK